MDRMGWIEDNLILFLPTLSALGLAHFIDFSLNWLNTVYWSAFYFIILSLLGGAIVGLYKREIFAKSLLKLSTYHPWSVVIPVCITFAGIPAEYTLIRSVYIANIVSITICLAWIWLSFVFRRFIGTDT